MNLELRRAGDPDVGPGEDVVDVPREEEADHHRQHEGRGRLDQPRAQLDQVVHQGRLGGLDLLLFVFAADLRHQLSLGARPARRRPRQAPAPDLPAAACGSGGLRLGAWRWHAGARSAPASARPQPPLRRLASAGFCSEACRATSRNPCRSTRDRSRTSFNGS